MLLRLEVMSVGSGGCVWRECCFSDGVGLACGRREALPDLLEFNLSE